VKELSLDNELVILFTVQYTIDTLNLIGLLD